MQIEGNVKYFYNRYQNRRLHRNLKHGTYHTDVKKSFYVLSVSIYGQVSEAETR